MSHTSLTALLFPSTNPSINALLATAYISGPPNLLLALCPPDIDPSSLSIMVAFAVGGLLGDTLLHLIPETFRTGEGDEAVLSAEQMGKRDLVLGLFIFVGFGVFVMMEKGLRILGAGGHGGHGHGHGYEVESHENDVIVGYSSGKDGRVQHGDGDADAGELRKRREITTTTTTTTTTTATTDTSLSGIPKQMQQQRQKEIKSTAYLNILADFTHNITDGLALSAAFYTSPLIGATTTLGIFFHEIPHEVGDFALLIQSGFSKWQAMGAQFLTAIGAFCGTLIGIAIQAYADGGSAGLQKGSTVEADLGLWKTGLKGGDLVLPFTAGTFLYVGFSAVPEILETDPKLSRMKELRKGLLQGLAMAAGFAIMFFVS